MEVLESEKQSLVEKNDIDNEQKACSHLARTECDKDEYANTDDDKEKSINDYCNKDQKQDVTNSDFGKPQEDWTKDGSANKKTQEIKADNEFGKKQNNGIVSSDNYKTQQEIINSSSGPEGRKSSEYLKQVTNDNSAHRDKGKNHECSEIPQNALKNDCGDDEFCSMENDVCSKEQQDRVKKDSCNGQQDVLEKADFDGEENKIKGDDYDNKKQTSVKRDSSDNEQHDARVADEINFPENGSSKHSDEKEQTGSVIDKESKNKIEDNEETKLESDITNSDSNLQAENDDEKSYSVKTENVHSVRKLHEDSLILRNKKRSIQREQIHTRQRSSSKDIVKLLKKKRSSHRLQSSSSQDDDQSVPSGMKRKRIPNRPGISFEVGARIEAKDYLDKWYPSKIIAVDDEAAEVLIHFERWSARFDEWMPMESPRIRAITHPSTRNEQKEKTSKVMPQYKAGEAVLARWTDCKMYPAKVLEVGANNCYEVLFYDGFHRTVQSLNIEKLPQEMADKVDFPSAPKSESPERKKCNPAPKETVKLPSKKIDKTVKEKTSKRDQNDLTSILGKRKRLIVGGIFQAKRNKIQGETCNSVSKQKSKKASLPSKESIVEATETSDVDESKSVSPTTSVGYIDGRKIARKEFIIEEDHNHFKCPVTSCGKSFRKDKLLQSHMKHYHDEARSREKKKSPSVVRDSRTSTNLSPTPVSPPCEKHKEREESKTEVIKTKLKTPVKEDASQDISKSNNAQLVTSPKAVSKPNIQESFRSGKASSKSSKTGAKCSRTNTSPEVSTDSKLNAVKPDGRSTRSDKSPKLEHKTTRADSKPSRTETRSSKLESKLTKTENKNIKTENRITKSETKAAKVENKVIKSDKNAKSENKSLKNENKTIKTECKLTEEKGEKKTQLRENKIPEESPTAQPLQIVDDIKVDNKMDTVSTVQTSSLPVENVHNSRSKKRRTTSVSDINVDASPTVDNVTHSVTPKEIDIKSEQKVIDVENIQDEVKPVITDFKLPVQDEDAEEAQSDEIIHCICNCIEENGLMMQCEVCLTWQHGACFDIDDVKEVPYKYVCYACLKPVGLRESFRYRHDLDWFNKGEMTTFSFLEEKLSSNVNETRSAHDLVASLHNAMLVIHSLKIKFKLLKEDNNPDLSMWKKPWADYSYMQNQELDSMEELVQPPRADFDHSYFSIKEDLSVGASALNTRKNPYDKMNKKESTNSTNQDGETSYAADRIKTNASIAKHRLTDKERTSSKQQNFVKTDKQVEFDPSECKKNLLDHLIQVQHGIEQQLNVIEEHLQVLESETGIPTLSDEDLGKEIGKSLCTIRKLMKDLSFVQQLANFQ